MKSQLEYPEQGFFDEILSWIQETKPDKNLLSRKKLELCKKYNKKYVPTDIEVYLHASEKDTEIIKRYLQTKPVRTGSGVAVIATMTKPWNCPHGSCTLDR